MLLFLEAALLVTESSAPLVGCCSGPEFPCAVARYGKVGQGPAFGTQIYLGTEVDFSGRRDSQCSLYHGAPVDFCQPSRLKRLERRKPGRQPWRVADRLSHGHHLRYQLDL